MKTFIFIAREYRKKYKDEMPFIWSMCKYVIRADISMLLEKYSSKK